MKKRIDSYTPVVVDNKPQFSYVAQSVSQLEDVYGGTLPSLKQLTWSHAPVVDNKPHLSYVIQSVSQLDEIYGDALSPEVTVFNRVDDVDDLSDARDHISHKLLVGSLYGEPVNWYSDILYDADGRYLSDVPVVVGETLFPDGDMVTRLAKAVFVRDFVAHIKDADHGFDSGDLSLRRVRHDVFDFGGVSPEELDVDGDRVGFLLTRNLAVDAAIDDLALVEGSFDKDRLNWIVNERIDKAWNRYDMLKTSFVDYEVDPILRLREHVANVDTPKAVKVLLDFVGDVFPELDYQKSFAYSIVGLLEFDDRLSSDTLSRAFDEYVSCDRTTLERVLEPSDGVSSLYEMLCGFFGDDDVDLIARCHSEADGIREKVVERLGSEWFADAFHGLSTSVGSDYYDGTRRKLAEDLLSRGSNFEFVAGLVFPTDVIGRKVFMLELLRQDRPTLESVRDGLTTDVDVYIENEATRNLVAELVCEYPNFVEFVISFEGRVSNVVATIDRFVGGCHLSDFDYDPYDEEHQNAFKDVIRDMVDGRSDVPKDVSIVRDGNFYRIRVGLGHVFDVVEYDSRFDSFDYVNCDVRLAIKRSLGLSELISIALGKPDLDLMLEDSADDYLKPAKSESYMIQQKTDGIVPLDIVDVEDDVVDCDTFNFESFSMSTYFANLLRDALDAYESGNKSRGNVLLRKAYDALFVDGYMDEDEEDMFTTFRMFVYWMAAMADRYGSPSMDLRSIRDHVYTNKFVSPVTIMRYLETIPRSPMRNRAISMQEILNERFASTKQYSLRCSLIDLFDFSECI